MGYRLNRRAAFGLGTVVAASSVLGSTPALAQEEDISPPTADRARARVKRVYDSAIQDAGGTWNAHISVADGVAVEHGSDDVVEAYSVNKVAAAVAVLDKIDRGEAKITDQVEVPEDIVIKTGDGVIPLDRAYPSVFTVGHILSLFLTVSDDTCVRLSGLVCAPVEINATMVAKGFPNTQVIPSASNPRRYFLGKTTPRETHGILQGIVKGTLLSPTSTDHILNVLRAQAAFTDGIRRNMSSIDRSRVATKAGWLNDGRNEAGVMFDKAGKPVLTYALFARGLPEHAPDFGGTHPFREAAARMGPKFLRAVDKISGDPAARTLRTQSYQPSNGG
ncbi:class A beta-lactamase-related serine hydrolase [Kibdelosporangium philippinense]|uniref:Class A beta-lactamase-related serine hydrolase n=1 Tax=Kibdelosporangium philippinense TaxID=211113 RepID=A0ABS8ZSK6_9PSEU|nr:serine hydrolase [Kibdelosporangium philippinense]MCE7010710.1 class A beta-lactamase-related serine hydrolase [Kibdelosporangium philippinense]